MLRKVFISLCVNIQGAWKDLVKKQHLRKTLASSVGALAGAEVGGGAAAILSKIKKKKDKKDKKKKDSKVKFKFEDDGDPDTDEDDDEEDGDSGSSSSSEDQAQIRFFRFFLLSFPPFVFFLQFLLHHRLLSLHLSPSARGLFCSLSLVYSPTEAVVFFNRSAAAQTTEEQEDRAPNDTLTSISHYFLPPSCMPQDVSSIVQ